MTKADKRVEVEDGFIVTVDGKIYGPFLKKDMGQWEGMTHKAGVTITPVRRRGGWVVAPPPAKRTPKDTSLPLLEGIGFTPRDRSHQRGGR